MAAGRGGGGLSMDTGLKCCIYGCVLVYQIYEINKYININRLIKRCILIMDIICKVPALLCTPLSLSNSFNL